MSSPIRSYRPVASYEGGVNPGDKMTSSNPSEMEVRFKMRVWRSLQQSISTITITSKWVLIDPLRRLLTPPSCPRRCRVTIDMETGSGRYLQFPPRWSPKQREDLIGVKTILSTQHWFLNSNLDWSRKTWRTDTDEMHVYKYQCSVENVMFVLTKEISGKDKISAGQLWKLLTVQCLF